MCTTTPVAIAEPSLFLAVKLQVDGVVTPGVMVAGDGVAAVIPTSGPATTEMGTSAATTDVATHCDASPLA